MVAHKIVSADSHMTEPADLWVQRLDKKYRDNAPRVIKNEKSTGPAYLFVGPGIHPLAVAAAFAAPVTRRGVSVDPLALFAEALQAPCDPLGRTEVVDLDDTAKRHGNTIGNAVRVGGKRAGERRAERQ